MNVVKTCKYGTMCYNTNDQWVGKSFQEYGEFSEGEVNLFKHVVKEGHTAFDVGANIGAHTIPLAKLVSNKGMVFAFEPQRLAYYSLCANTALNNLTNVYCLQNAVSNTDGRMNIPELDYRKSNNFGGLEINKAYPNAPTCSVRVIKLDTYLNLPRLDFLKIDVEGMEWEVLNGGEKIIEKYNPIIYLESDRKEKVSFLIMTLRRMGYEIYFHAPPLFNSENFTLNTTNVFSNSVSINLFCHKGECPVNPEAFNMQKLDASKRKVVLSAPQIDQDRVFEDIKINTIKDLIAMAEMQSEIFFNCDKAMEYLDLAIKINPKDPSLLQQAAPILTRHLRYTEALDFVERGLKSGGMNPDTLMSRGIVLSNLNRFEEAIDMFRTVLKLDPNNVEAHFSLAIDLLMIGQYEEGWKEYAWRFKRTLPALSQFLSTLPTDVPNWTGEELDGKRLMVYCEQGAGDILHFIRYLPLIKNAHAILICYKEMEKLLRNEAYEVIPYNEEGYLPDIKCDYMVSLLDLPGIFKTVPVPKKYVEPKNGAVFDLSPYKNMLKIGIVWAGSETHANDFTRSCKLTEFKDIAAHEGVALFSLQMGNMERYWPNIGKVNLKDGADFKLIDFTDRISDFNDTARLIEKLDLVISVDTSVLHLAAAMGKEAWLLHGINADWRWMNTGDKTHWYPSVRVFRGEDWQEVFGNVSKELHEKVTLNAGKWQLRKD